MLSLYLQIEDDSLPPPGQPKLPLRVATVVSEDDPNRMHLLFDLAVQLLDASPHLHPEELDT